MGSNKGYTIIAFRGNQKLFCIFGGTNNIFMMDNANNILLLKAAFLPLFFVFASWYMGTFQSLKLL